ncbi:MAG TPA: ATP-binding protein [Longimicrobiales bacterium]|nr:ATP-binding protein [Longimicrobiales bacterium]
MQHPHGRSTLARPASLAAQLLIPLLGVLGGVMAAFLAWSLVQRERTLVSEARRETQAYATALGLALDAAFRDPDRAGVPEIVERISLRPSIYGVVVYDPQGNPLYGPGVIPGAEASTPEEVRAVLASGGQTEFERAQDEVDVYSVVRPILGETGEVVGAFEVLQPLNFVEEEKARTRWRFLLNTVVLVAAVTILLRWLVRRLVSDPLDRFSDDVRALGAGRLDHRVEPTATVSELAAVAEELNRMAEGLEQARSALVRGAEERITLERQVRQSEKMAMIGQLAAGLAHEIGAPLHVIRGRADLLARRAARPDAEARDLRIIVEQIDRITRIVRGLLDFARQKEPRADAVDLVAVVDGVLELVAPELEPSAIVTERRGVSCALVQGDRDHLQQVILNVVLNAAQALAEADGERRIDVDVGLAEARGGGRVLLRVADTGPGIPAEHRERVFDPFFTTKPSGTGTGLGLAVARWIVEEHRGTVRVLPGVRRGTTIEIELPRNGAENDGG